LTFGDVGQSANLIAPDHKWSKFMTRRKSFWLIAILVTILFGPLAEAAQTIPIATQPLAIGDALTIKSAVMGEERQVNVYLPPEYSTSKQKYPVLYLIDGGLDQDFLHISGATHLGALWGRSQPMIVVGIATKDRRRELVGPTRSAELLTKYPTAGSSARFRDFIRDEVFPAISSQYRTSGESGVIGESLAGLFIVETYLREPGLFTHYAAISPSLWWDDNRLANEAAGLLAMQKKQSGKLYLTMANEGPDTEAGMATLIKALQSRKGWCSAPKPGLTHATIYHTVSPEALQYIFPEATPPDPRSGFAVRCQMGN
jgi:predicted alpha/beta superfamily hydrolase